MKATEANLLKFLQGTKQFIIPIYQRPYSWTLKQCRQLWSDILRLIQDRKLPGHFVGSIVYIEKGIYQVTTVPQLLVIDGQQRLATISLLLAALGKSIERENVSSDVSRKKIENYYLFNSEEADEQRYKLLLTQSDKDTLIRLVGDQPPVDGASHRLMENYAFFEKQIKESGVDLTKLFEAINKLIIVDVSLDRNYDNPQLIFESLNSTGLDLSQADLIRNYVLMGLEPHDQTRLYRTFWYPMEQSFGHAEYSEIFDQFMRDYLTINTGRIPNVGEVYENFKQFVRDFSAKANTETNTSPLEIIGAVVADVHRYSKYFVALDFQRTEDKEIDRILEDINTLRVDVAYPFLMKVFDDYHEGRLSRDVLVEVLKLVESYVFRRSICGIPTNSLNKTFATLYREVKTDAYLESLRAALLLKDGYRRFPSDEEFKRELLAKDVYNFRNRNYLLSKLENFERKEPVKVEEFTIEHVMPQNSELTKEWQEELGENWRAVQSQYLHTIGNLTLTGYNPELGDRPFVEKRDMKGGFKDSPIRLNRTLATLEHWNESEIFRRARMLADIVIGLWTAPALQPRILQKYRPVEAAEAGRKYTLEDHSEYLQGDLLDVFEHLRKRILNLDSAVKEEVLKHYIAYKIPANFVEVQPQKQRLKLWLSVNFEELDDPKGMCQSSGDVGHWGTGDVWFALASEDQLDDAMHLVRQAFEQQREDGNG